jgi:hypothetical protein
MNAEKYRMFPLQPAKKEKTMSTIAATDDRYICYMDSFADALSAFIKTLDLRGAAPDRPLRGWRKSGSPYQPSQRRPRASRKSSRKQP